MGRLSPVEMGENSAKREVIAGDSETGDDALAAGSDVRRQAAAGGVGDMHLEGWEFHHAEGGHQRAIAAGEAGGVENGGVKAASALKKADPLAYEAWAVEWKAKNPDSVAVPVKTEAAAEPKARKPRSDKGKPRVKKAAAEESAAEEDE